MTKQVQRRRGTATQHTSFTGAEGEISVNTTNKSVHVHDGVTAGGIEAARADMTNVTDANLNARLNGNTLSSLTITSADINGGTIDGTVIGGTTAAAITGTTLTATSSATLQHSASTKLATTSTGVDITGTVTADGLTVDGGTTTEVKVFSQGRVNPTTLSEGASGAELMVGSSNPLTLGTAGSDRLNIAANGDISFYEDTGTTPKFFWDASLETLTLGGTEWPSSTIGEAAGRHMINYDGEPRLLLWDASTGAAGNEAHIMIGGKPVNSATQFSGATISAGVENGTDADGYLAISTTNAASTSVEHMRIASSGNVGIGTDSPAELIHIYNGAAAAYLKATNNASTQGIEVGISSAGDGVINVQDAAALRMFTSDTERMRITSDGSVGIGTSSPSHPLTIKADGTSGNAIKILGDSTNNSGRILWRTSTDSSATAEISVDSSENMIFGAGGNAEDMRLTNSGHLLVGTTDSQLNNESTNTGVVIRADNQLQIARSEGVTAYFNRLTSDGDIVQFRKDGASVGSIGTYAGSISIGGNGNGAIYFNGVNDIRPWNKTTNTNLDASMDLGDGAARFKDLYLSGGVYLGGTGAANKLDDYEEGTFTPVVADASSGGNTATGTFNGQYTKVGRQVTLLIELSNIDTTGMTGTNDLFILGLPFSPASLAGNQRAVGSMWGSLLAIAAATPNLVPNLDDAVNYIRIIEYGDGLGSDYFKVSQVSSGTSDIFINITYFA